ncbi:MAG: hypothetical protein JNK02_08935 [Planctomycetes bacterium]|nr:hypothetical protein [Planctomycetota bacterium]
MTVVDWVVINGARIERSFFEENVSEAREYSWELTRWENPEDHGHCMICNVALAGRDECYQSESGWLCPYCFESFVVRDETI